MTRLLAALAVPAVLCVVASAGDPKPAPAAVKPVVAVTDRGLEVGGVPLTLNKSGLDDLAKAAGPPDRVVAPVEGASQRIALWDRKGLRAYFSSRTRVVATLDCVFDTLPGVELYPNQGFSGDLTVGGVGVTAATSLADLGGVVDKAPAPGGEFRAKFQRHEVDFTLTKDRKGVEMVRLTYRIGR